MREDVLSDDKGQLRYGQPARGGQKMQLLTVPFRCKRERRLILEDAIPGTATGTVAIRRRVFAVSLNVASFSSHVDSLRPGHNPGQMRDDTA